MIGYILAGIVTLGIIASVLLYLTQPRGVDLEALTEAVEREAWWPFDDEGEAYEPGPRR